MIPERQKIKVLPSGSLMHMGRPSPTEKQQLVGFAHPTEKQKGFRRMPTDTKTLERFELFSGLKQNELEAVAALMHPMRVTEGEVLIRGGDPAHTFFVVLSGNFMLYFKEGRAMTLHKEGDIMGWSTIVTPFQYKGTAVALTDGEVLSMSGQEFLQLIQGDSSIGDKIMKRINKIISERMPFISGP